MLHHSWNVPTLGAPMLPMPLVWVQIHNTRQGIIVIVLSYSACRARAKAIGGVFEGITRRPCQVYHMGFDLFS